jgi:hypothetical protein
VAEKRSSGLPIQSITLLLAVAGVVIGVWQYRETNSEQYKKEIWSAQKELFELAITAATTIANGESLEAVSGARGDFWRLYWGNLAMLESRNVESAMVKFGNKLRECEKSKDPGCFPVPGGYSTELQHLALNLAHCARDTLRTTWEPVDIGKLTAVCEP